MDNNNNGSFRKVIGVFGGISLVAGMTIGSGVYYLNAYVLQRVDMSLGWSIVCWIIGGVVSILGGLCFAELGAERPVAGGNTIYLGEAYTPALGFLNGFLGFILTGSGSIASLALAAVTAFQGVWGLNTVELKLIAIALIVVLTVINVFGVQGASYLQNVTMVLRVVPLVLIIVVGFTMGTQSPDLSLTTPANASGKGISGMITVVGYATFASLWAYEGWENLNTVAEEMRNPKKDLPLAIIISIGFITLIYTLFQLAVYKVLPYDTITQMAGSENNIYLGNEVAQRTMGNVGTTIVLVGMTIGILGTLNGDVLVFPRTYYAMSKEGYFPKMFQHIDKRGIPLEATIASSAISIFLVIFNSLQSLTDMLIFVSAVINCLTIAAVLVYRKKYPNLERPYKVWGGAVTVVIAIILYGVLLVNEFVSNPKSAIIGVLITLAGLIVYAYFKKKNGGQEYKGEGLE